MKAIEFLNKHLPFLLFWLFLLGFYMLAFAGNGGVVLDVILECARPWFEPLRALLIK